MRQPPLDVVIAGSPRSGTTLVQRLVGELEGVSVPPETHVLSLRGLPLLRARAFPMTARDLDAELERYTALPTSDGLDLDVERVRALLRGRCESLWDLYAAITRALVGPAEAIGEKTPDHLQWWAPLASAWPASRFVLVVRDPRAVVASSLDVPFGMDSVSLLARRWRADEREIAVAVEALGDRVLLLRYEHVAASPDTAREALAALLDRDPVPTERGPRHLAWETWKQRAAVPITDERVAAWTSRLTETEVATIEKVCEEGMSRQGYARVSDSPAERADPATRLRAAYFEITRRRRRRSIRRLGRSRY